MSQPRILSYEEVIAETHEPHLLLGNGFSISCRPNVFTYGRLFEQADFASLVTARQAFDVLHTTNFETVIRALRDFSALAKIYVMPPTEAGTVASNDAASLREVLVRAVATSHPDRPHHLATREYLSCRRFLRGYKSINTVNYDLLLYWALMQRDLGDEEIPCDDGFRKPIDDPNAEYVSWDPDTSKVQTIRYLHGALHLFDTGTEMKKYTWINTQRPLIEQIREALNREFYPVFVSEGTSAEKIERIRHNDYLCKMYRSFTEIRGTLVVFGHSLDVSDDHIFIDRIGKRGKINRLYVGVYGDPSTPSNAKIIEKSSALSIHRSRKQPLEVYFFDSATAQVWT